MQRSIAFFLLVFLSPILVILWFLVKITSPGTFVFKQSRMGKDFQPFFIYKIRTMYQDAELKKKKLLSQNEADGPVFKIRKDPRLTPIGKFLSATGLDEALQLVNIIKGEMNFVGPRPLPVNEANDVPVKYRARFKVRPGITSFWIIRGAHELSFSDWMKSDLEYIRRKNPITDIFIFVNTIYLVFVWTIKEIHQHLKI